MREDPIFVQQLMEVSLDSIQQVGNAYFPINEEEVAAVLREAKKQSRQVHVASTMEKCRVSKDVMILCTQHLVHPNSSGGEHWSEKKCTMYYANHVVRVGPTVALKSMQEILKKKNLLFPPKPLHTTVVSTVLSGETCARSFYHGKVQSWVEGIRLVLWSGDIFEVRRGQFKNNDGYFELSDGTTLHGEAKSDLLDVVLRSNLGVVTAIDVRVIDLPDMKHTVLFFEEMNWKVIEKAQDVHSLEFVDNAGLQLLREKMQVPALARCALFVEHEESALLSECLEQWDGSKKFHEALDVLHKAIKGQRVTILKGGELPELYIQCLQMQAKQPGAVIHGYVGSGKLGVVGGAN